MMRYDKIPVVIDAKSVKSMVKKLKAVKATGWNPTL